MTESCPPPGECVFLKLGGSLLTDKTRVECLRGELGRDLCRQIAAARDIRPDLKLVLGIGSGSFGHVHARRYRLDRGADDPRAWYGATLTADSAARLVRQVIAWLGQEGVPAWSFQPGAAWSARAGRIEMGEASIVRDALRHGVLPVVHGDVMLDAERGVAIVSTEEVFRFLARHIPPARILLAGEVPGVLRNPHRTGEAPDIVPVLRAGDARGLTERLGGSRGTDVTGGMASKVSACFNMVRETPSLSVHIFDGRPPQAVREMLLHEAGAVGTRIEASGQHRSVPRNSHSEGESHAG